MKFLILDGYVDEPTCLGVPPFISTYVRYAAGAAICAGAGEVVYRTIDQVRQSGYALDGGLTGYAGAALIAGNPVPGKYLGGLPLQEHEISRLSAANPGLPLFLGGPIRFAAGRKSSGNVHYVSRDIEQFVYHFLRGSPREEDRTIQSLERFAAAGAQVVRQHPRFPDVIAEIETGRGCPRRSHCSFCIEGSYTLETRDPAGVAAEIRALHEAGVRYFRLGKQADLFSYGSLMTDWKNGFPRPRPEMLEELYAGIRAAAPDLKVLHLDNVNPGTLANYPEESLRICDTIAKHNTPGDVAALGMESADPAVVAANSLKASPEDVMRAVAIINEAGGRRENGIPKLLPGVNLIHGLPGETRDTFRLNYEFLKRVLDSGLLLRRINIRQVRVSAGTALADFERPRGKEQKKLEAAFRNYREKIRSDVDAPMIRKIFPPGTVFSGLIVESHRGDWSIARGLGSYAIAVNVPRKLPLLSRLDVFTVGTRERSLVGLPDPFILSRATLTELKAIPGLAKTAGQIIASRDPQGLEASPVYDQMKCHIIP